MLCVVIAPIRSADLSAPGKGRSAPCESRGSKEDWTTSDRRWLEPNSRAWGVHGTRVRRAAGPRPAHGDEESPVARSSHEFLLDQET